MTWPPKSRNVSSACPRAMGYAEYAREALLGEGTFGRVYRAKVRENGRVVAIKKLLNSRSAKEGAELSTLREIMLLHELKHEHVIEMIEAFAHQGSIHLVFEYCETDLEIVIKQTQRYEFDAAKIKADMLGTLRGIAWIHASWVLHRDIKPGNLFLTPAGVVKVGDFGLARFFGSPERKYTGQVVTRWYRAPELLFGAKFYGTSIDMWSAGCVFAELLLRVPYVPGNSDIEQLSRIFSARGTPAEDTWPGVSSLPDYIAFKEQKAQPLRELFRAASPETLNLLNACLTLNPGERISAQGALDHAYFTEDPPPAPLSEIAPKPAEPAPAKPKPKPKLNFDGSE